MRYLLSVFCLASALFAADESWDKVRELKSGTELRIYQHGNPKPLVANLDEATEDKLVIATKTEQRAIAKEDIDRLDFRPPQKGGSGPKVTRETRSTVSDPAAEPVPTVGVPHGANVPQQSQSSSVSFGGGSKPDFETIYRRHAPAPADTKSH